MRRLASAAAVMVVTAGLAACGGGSPVSPSGLAGSGSRFSLGDSAGSTLSDSDTSWATWAAQLNAAMVALGGLAGQNGDTQEVKFFGAQLAQSHRTATDQLMQATGDTVRTSSLGDAQATYDRLYRLSGSAFDRAFVPAIIQLHQTAIARLRSQGASSDRLQQYSRELLPDLQAHLAMARELAGRVGVDLPSDLR